MVSARLASSRMPIMSTADTTGSIALSSPTVEGQVEPTVLEVNPSEDVQVSWPTNVSEGDLERDEGAVSTWIGKRGSGAAPTSDLITTFNSSSWIWATETDTSDAPAGQVAFRKTYTPTTGKLATFANILITADNQFSLFVDGNFVGLSPQTTDIWKNAQFFQLMLNTSGSSHLFAVLATNLADPATGDPSPAGLLAAIQIQFSDGTSTFITTESSWIYTTLIVAGWNTPSGSTSGWSAAEVIGPYGAANPQWGNQVVTPTSTPSDLTFDNSFWIWSAESSPPYAPPGQRAFRTTVTAPSGRTLQSVSVIITVDNQFVLYVNGQLIGESPDQTDVWRTAQWFTVPLGGTSAVFAVNATNLYDVDIGGPSPAGLLAKFRVSFTDGSTSIIVSDTTWKVSSTLPAGFQEPSFNDSSWSDAVSQGVSV